jgi:hypothetical protein
MILAKARAKASVKAKQIYNTGINYDCHLRLSKYFYSTGLSSPFGFSDSAFKLGYCFAILDKNWP